MEAELLAPVEAFSEITGDQDDDDEDDDDGDEDDDDDDRSRASSPGGSVLRDYR